MHLHRLKLVNFRLHADTDIVFGSGITAIVGANGSGKSTLLESIAWAFYGNSAARGSRDSVRRHRAPPRAPVRVEVEFSLGAHEYRVVRTLYSAELYQDGGGGPVANSQQAVTAKMSRLLAMSRGEFFNTYFTGQKELAVMSAMGPTERAKFLSRLMGYERLRLAQDQLRMRRSAIRGELAGVERGIEAEEVLQQEQHDARDHVRNAETALAEISQAHQEAEARLADVGPRWKEIGALRESVQSLQGERGMAEQQVREARREFERLDRELADALLARDQHKELEPALADADALRAEAERLDLEARAAGQRRSLTGQLREVHTQLEVLDKRLRELSHDDNVIGSAQAALNEAHAVMEELGTTEERLRTNWVRDRQDAETKRLTLRDQYRDLKKHNDDIVAAGPDGQCPTCARPLGSEFETVLASVAQQLEEVESSGKFFKQRVAQLAKEPDELLEIEAKQTEASRRVREMVQQLAKVEADVRQRKELRDEHERLCERRARIEQEITELPDSYDEERHDEVRKRFRELAPLTERAMKLQIRAERGPALVGEAETAERVLSEREALVRELQEAIAESGFSDETYAAIREEHRTAEATLRQREVQLAGARGDLKVVQSTLEAVDRRMEERKRQVKQLRDLKKQLALHDELDGAFEALRGELNGRLRPDLSDVASDLLGELTDGRYDEIELDEQYRLSIVEEGVPKEVISGGEEDVANLVLRLAISQMVAERAGLPLSLLVLDEIFGGLDEERRRGVVHLLRGLAGRFPQVILITHIESVRDDVDRVLRVTFDSEEGAARIEEDDEPVTREDVAA